MDRVIYSHVAVIGVDGMGNFNTQANTPVLDALFADGAVTAQALSMDPTISAENWGAMLLGVEPMVHGLTNSIVGRFPYTNDALPSVFRRIREKLPDANLVSCSNWDPINRGIIEQDCGVTKITAETDELLCPQIEKQIESKPLFLFVQFDDVDGAGHGNTYGSEKHLEQIEKTDVLIGRLVESYKKAGIWADTLFIVTADHGGYRRSHGGFNDTEKYVFLGACGKGIRKSKIGYVRTKDIAAIVLYALGMDVPAYDAKGFSAQLPNGLFPEARTDYIMPAPKPYTPPTKETPAFDSAEGLASFVPKERIRLALFMDNDLTDSSGHCTPTEYGLVKYYSQGVFGARGEFGATGYAVYPELKLGERSFTLAVWLKIDRSLREDVSVCGTKNWERGHREGFELVLRSSDTELMIGCRERHISIVTPFYEEISDGWVHAMFCVDKKNAEVRVYYNFKYVRTVKLEGDLLCSADALPFTVGNDAMHHSNNIEFQLLLNMDDLFIFNDVPTETEIQSFAAYYGIEA